MTSLMAAAIRLSRAEARRLLEAPPLIDREREILVEVGREETGVAMKIRRTHIAGTNGPVRLHTLCGLVENRRNVAVPAGEATCRSCRTLNDPRPVSREYKRLAARAEARVALALTNVRSDEVERREEGK